MADGHSFNSISLGGRGGTNPGQLKVHSGGIVWKKQGGGKAVEVDKSGLLSLTWMKVSRSNQLGVQTKDGLHYKFTGFRDQDVASLTAFFQFNYGKRPEEKQLAVSGKNWGDVDLNEETGVMSETCGRAEATWANISMGLDLFGLCSSEVAELLAQDEDLVPFLQNRSYIAGNINGVGIEKGITKNSYPTKEKNIFNGSTSLYFNGVGALLPEFKKERLKILLRQSVFTLSSEVDEVIKPILSLCQLRSCLRYKDSLLSSSNGLPQNIDESIHAHKKHKALPSSLVDDDIRFVLENDSTKVEELMNTHSDELFSMLQHMEQKLEELLNAVMTTCSPMTPNEKQQLCKRIKELPPRNVDRVVEILGHSKTSRKDSCNVVYFDLDSEDQITLRRLYFYVSAIEKAMRHGKQVVESRLGT